MKTYKKMFCLLTASALLLAGCGQQSGERDGAGYDINSVPDEIRAIKYDPFVNINGAYGEDYYGDDQTAAIAGKVSGWKERGFNTIYLIAYYSSGATLYETKNADHPYDAEKLGPDFLEELVSECRKQGMSLFAGAWMFRDKPQWNKHPQWRQKMTAQADASEGLLCPFSPYMDEVFYPYFESLYDRYGIKNFFLQEMWFNWDGMGKSSSFSSYSIEAFNKLTGKSYSVEDVKTLENDIARDETINRQWYQMHFDKEVEIIDRLRGIGGGTVAWHNLREAEWSFVTQESSRLDGVFINFMSLYPDIQIFNAKSTDDLDPYLCYAGVSDFVKRTGDFRKVLEYYSLYGMAGLERALTQEDYLYVYLAARAAGIRELVVEQDAFINRADQQNPVAWDSIAMTYAVYDPVFEGAAYTGQARNAAWADGQESARSNGRFLTGWESGDAEIVIAGVSLYKPAASLTLTSGDRRVTDVYGNVLDDGTVTLESGQVRLFLIEKN